MNLRILIDIIWVVICLCVLKEGIYNILMLLYMLLESWFCSIWVYSLIIDRTIYPSSAYANILACFQLGIIPLSAIITLFHRLLLYHGCNPKIKYDMVGQKKVLLNGSDLLQFVHQIHHQLLLLITIDSFHLACPDRLGLNPSVIFYINFFLRPHPCIHTVMKNISVHRCPLQNRVTLKFTLQSILVNQEA